MRMPRRQLSPEAIKARLARQKRIQPIPNGVFTSFDPYRLQFEFLGLPPNANASGGSRNLWAIKKERDMWINAVKGLIASHLPPRPLERARLTLVRFSSVEPDYDGLVGGFKAIIDALVQAKVIANDKYGNIGVPNYRPEKVPPGEGKVRVIVEEILEANAA